jgi:hypothetical protein
MGNLTTSGSRVGAIELIVAMLIMFAGAITAGITLGQGEASFGSGPEAVLAAIAARPRLWSLADILILLAIVLTALGLAPITASFGGSGRLWAQAGFNLFLISAVLGVVRRTLSIQLEPWVAVNGIAPDELTIQALSRVGDGLGEWFTILSLASVISLGIALVLPRQSMTLGWLFVAWGAAGMVMHFVGAGIPAFIFFGTGGLGAVVLLTDLPGERGGE